MEDDAKIPVSESTVETVEMTEVDGIQQGAVLDYIAQPVKKSALPRDAAAHLCR